MNVSEKKMEKAITVNTYRIEGMFLWELNINIFLYCKH